MKNEDIGPISHNNLPEAVAKMLQEMLMLRNELAELKKSFQPKTPTVNMTRGEVALFLRCDESSVHNWTKQGKLHKRGIGNKVLYKRSEVEAALKDL